jgi:hypothetical protein
MGQGMQVQEGHPPLIQGTILWSSNIGGAVGACHAAGGRCGAGRCSTAVAQARDPWWIYECIHLLES